MTFRISSFNSPVLALILSFYSWGNAQITSAIPDKSWTSVYQKSSIQFVSKGSDYAAATPGRHPEWLQMLMSQYLSYQPTDLTPTPTGECELFKLREAIRLAADPKVRTRIVEQYQIKCPSLFNAGPSNHFKQTLKMFTMNYDVDVNPFFHRVIFSLPDGQKLKGVFAIKDNKARPMVIVRAGITGNVEEAFAERFFFYQLFERGLFNVLLVENMTSTDYIHNNRSLNFGGIAEAYQNIWLAQILRSHRQPISRIVQSVHLMGLSLGGQGVLTSAWLARYQANPRLFSSYLTMCPLVNTMDTFDHLTKKSLIRFPMEFWARSRFVEFKKWRPDLFKGYFGLPNKLLSAVSQNYRKPSASLLGVREPWFIQKQTDFASLHQLSKWDPTLRDPVWVWVTNEDDIVPASLNTDQLQFVGPLRIYQGTHCSFPVVWDNRMLSTILTGHILGTAALNLGEKQVKLDVHPNYPWVLSDVRFYNDRQVIEIELSGGEKIKKSFMVNRSDLDFGFRSLVLSEPEKMMLRRWSATKGLWEKNGNDPSLMVSWPVVK